MTQEELEGKYVETKVIAGIFDVTVRRIQQLTQDGVIKTTEVPKEGRRYELLPTIKMYTKHLSDKAHGKGRAEREVALRQQKLEAEIALKESQGEIHRIKAEIAAGKYIDVDEVTLDYQKFFAIFKRFAMGMPSRLVGMISDSLDPMEARRVEKEMTAEVKRMLHAFVVCGHTAEEMGEEKKKRKKHVKT